MTEVVVQNSRAFTMKKIIESLGFLYGDASGFIDTGYINEGHDEYPICKTALRDNGNETKWFGLSTVKKRATIICRMWIKSDDSIMMAASEDTINEAKIIAMELEKAFDSNVIINITSKLAELETQIGDYL